MTTIDLEATSPKHLADKYAIVGVGETHGPSAYRPFGRR